MSAFNVPAALPDRAMETLCDERTSPNFAEIEVADIDNFERFGIVAPTMPVAEIVLPAPHVPNRNTLRIDAEAGVNPETVARLDDHAVQPVAAQHAPLPQEMPCRVLMLVSQDSGTHGDTDSFVCVPDPPLPYVPPRLAISLCVPFADAHSTSNAPSTPAPFGTCIIWLHSPVLIFLTTLRAQMASHPPANNHASCRRLRCSTRMRQHARRAGLIYCWHLAMQQPTIQNAIVAPRLLAQMSVGSGITPSPSCA